MIDIVIADDHAIFREGLRNLLAAEADFRILGEAGTGPDALQICQEQNPDLILLDIDLPEMDGIEVTRRIQDRNLAVKIIVLTMHTNEEYAVRMMRLGASGYIPKYVSGQVLPGAIRTVMAGGLFLPDQIRESVLKRSLEARTSELDCLTDRELQVFKSCAEGKSANEIAEELGISPRTVETHKFRLMEKMGLKNTAELVRAAIRLGIA